MAHSKFAVLILALVFLMGCSITPPTEEEIFEREDRRNLIIEQHDRDVASCERASGMMIYRKWSASRIKRPLTNYEMKTAECVGSLRFF